MPNKVIFGKVVNCLVCKKEFYATPRRLKTARITCSISCKKKLPRAVRKSPVQIECVICKKSFFRKASHYDRVLYNSCSEECKRQCKKLYARGANNSNYKNRTKEEAIFNERAVECNRRGKIMEKECDLTQEDLMFQWYKQKGLCFYTGFPMILIGKKSSNTMSVDRVDSEIGYTKSNIVLCCLSVNMMKSNYKLYDIVNILNCYSSKLNNQIPVKIINKTSFKLKNNNTENVGIDLYVNNIEEFDNYIKVATGVHVQPPVGFYFDLVVRSSTYKKGLTLYNNIGVIDRSYTGEIFVILQKTSDFKELPKIGDRLCQLILRQSILVDLVETDSLNNTARGDSGFGSSGN